MSDTRGRSERGQADAEQITSPIEPFPPVSDASLDEISSPQAAVAAATGSPITSTEPGGNTVVWLPPSPYNAIKDKWQDQFIWQPTAFASDLPLNQTSFIGVNRSRENSAAAHPGVVAGHVPVARTLGDISEGPSKADGERKGDDNKEGLQGDYSEHRAQGQPSSGPSSSSITNTQRSRLSPAAAKKKSTQRRPVKLKQWHSFHLLKDPDPDQANNQGPSTSSRRTDEVINVPDLPHQGTRQTKQTDKGKAVGSVPVLVPEPRENTNSQNDTSSRDTDRYGKQHTYPSHINTNNTGPSSGSPPRSQHIHRQNPSLASTTPTLAAAEEALQQAVQEHQDGHPTNAIIVAEMPENSSQRPRQPLVVPAIAPNSTSPPPHDTTGNDSIPSRSSTRRRRSRKKASAIQEATPEQPLTWTPPQSSAGSYSQHSHSPAPSSVSGTYASSSSAVSRRPTRRSASQRPSVFEQSVLFNDVDNHRRAMAMQVARTSTPPQQQQQQQWLGLSNSRSNSNGSTTRRERQSASPRLNTQSAPTGKPGGGGLRAELSLNLEIEVQLKAKIHGDLTLSLYS